MKIRAAFFALAILCLTAYRADARPKSHTTPVETDVTGLVMRTGFDGAPAIELSGGQFLPLKEALEPETKVVFEDLMPGANWGHPAFLKLFRRGRMIARHRLHLPPRFLAMAKRSVIARSPKGEEATPPKKTEPVFGPPAPPSETRPEEPFAELNLLDVKFTINDLKGVHRVKEPQKFHAILINGNPDQRHWNDFSFLYRTLTQVYGYLPENIHVADSTYKDTKGDLDGSGQNRIRYLSSVNGVKDLFAQLKGKLTATDQVLIAINDHGSVVENETTIVLQDAEMKSSEFATLVKSLPTKRILAIFEQCFSGGFVRHVAEDQTVAMAASTNREFSWSTDDMRFNEFFYHIIAAFAFQTHDGKPVNADRNANGKVSAQEAFAYAVEKDAMSESPMLEAAPNSGMAALIGVSF